jgi:uncharacterized integral membrane protein
VSALLDPGPAPSVAVSWLTVAEPRANPEGAHPEGRARNRRITRLVIGAIALIYGIIFVVLNRSNVRIHFLFFTVTTRLWVGFLVSLALGGLLVQAAGVYRRRSKADHHKGGAAAE